MRMGRYLLLVAALSIWACAPAARNSKHAPAISHEDARPADPPPVFYDDAKPADLPASCRRPVVALTDEGRRLGARAQASLLSHLQGEFVREAQDALGEDGARTIYVASDPRIALPAKIRFKEAANDEIEAIARKRGNFVPAITLSTPGQKQASPPVVHVIFSSGPVRGRPLEKNETAPEYGAIVGYCVYERGDRLVFVQLFRIMS